MGCSGCCTPATWRTRGSKRKGASRETVKSNGVCAPSAQTASAFYGGRPLECARAAPLAIGAAARKQDSAAPYRARSVNYLLCDMREYLILSAFGTRCAVVAFAGRRELELLVTSLWITTTNYRYRAGKNKSMKAPRAALRRTVAPMTATAIIMKSGPMSESTATSRNPGRNCGLCGETADAPAAEIFPPALQP